MCGQMMGGQIFKPIDYTRVDPIVNVVFTTAEDKEDSDVGGMEGDVSDPE